MARPRNMLVMVSGKVLSVTPKNFAAFLKGKVEGRPSQLVGKALGDVSVDATSISATDAASLLERLVPTSAETSSDTEVSS